jgi:phospholipid transport system transporter-binding protein
VFRFAGPITMDNASANLAACIRAIDAGESELGLDALAHSDSSAVAVIIAARRHAGLTGRTLRLTGVPAAVESLAKLYGVENYVGG